MAFAALAAGVSGLQAFSEGVGVIADNITNVNTIGYKESRMRFSTLVTETSRTTAYEGIEQGEHYNLADDPGECENRWDDQAARSAAIEQLIQEMLRVGNHTPRPKYSA